MLNTKATIMFGLEGNQTLQRTNRRNADFFVLEKKKHTHKKKSGHFEPTTEPELILLSKP